MSEPIDRDIRLAKQVAIFMAAFGRAQRQDASDHGHAARPMPVDVTAGLLAGVARAYCARAGCDRHAVPRVLRELARLRPEYAHVPDRLLSELGSDTVAAWSDIAEAAVDAVDQDEDPMPALLEFAWLVRLHGPDADGRDAIDFDPVGAFLMTHPVDGAPRPPLR